MLGITALDGQRQAAGAGKQPAIKRAAAAAREPGTCKNLDSAAPGSARRLLFTRRTSRQGYLRPSRGRPGGAVPPPATPPPDGTSLAVPRHRGQRYPGACCQETLRRVVLRRMPQNFPEPARCLLSRPSAHFQKRPFLVSPPVQSKQFVMESATSRPAMDRWPVNRR